MSTCAQIFQSEVVHSRLKAHDCTENSSGNHLLLESKTYSGPIPATFTTFSPHILLYMLKRLLKVKSKQESDKFLFFVKIDLWSHITEILIFHDWTVPFLFHSVSLYHQSAQFNFLLWRWWFIGSFIPSGKWNKSAAGCGTQQIQRTNPKLSVIFQVKQAAEEWSALP